MDSAAIHEAAEATLAGTMSFPDIVAKLVAAGVEYYHVDYVARCKHFQDGVGACVSTPITYENLPAVAAELDVDALVANIRDSQVNGAALSRLHRSGDEGWRAGVFRVPPRASCHVSWANR